MKYKCGFCGKEYDNPADYAACVGKCAAEKKQEDEKKRKEKLAAEKASRLEELKSAHKNYINLVNEFIDDYGTVSLGTDVSFPFVDDFFWVNLL